MGSHSKHTCFAYVGICSQHVFQKHRASVINPCQLQVDPALLNPGQVTSTVFEPVWRAHFDGNGKVQLLTEINKSFLYKLGSGSWAKAVLLVVEHILSAGRGTSGSGGRGSHWDGTLSIEHILPQVRLHTCCSAGKVNVGLQVALLMYLQ